MTKIASRGPDLIKVSWFTMHVIITKVDAPTLFPLTEMSKKTVAMK